MFSCGIKTLVSLRKLGQNFCCKFECSLDKNTWRIESLGIAVVKSKLGTWAISTYFVKAFLYSGRFSRGSWA